MATQSDGSIVVDTNVDPHGFEKGSAELRQATVRLQKQFEGMGKQLEHTVAKYQRALASGDMSGLSSIRRGIEKASDAALEFQRQLEAVFIKG